VRDIPPSQSAQLLSRCPFRRISYRVASWRWSVDPQRSSIWLLPLSPCRVPAAPIGRGVQGGREGGDGASPFVGRTMGIVSGRRLAEGGRVLHRVELRPGGWS